MTNVFQAAILSLFNSQDTYTVKDIKEKTNVPDEYLKPALIYLCNPKIKVLLKEIKKPTLDNPAEKISINLKYASSNIKTSVMPAQAVKKKEDTDKQDQDTANEVKIERQVICQANTVKLMKANKKMAFMDLQREVMGMI